LRDEAERRRDEESRTNELMHHTMDRVYIFNYAPSRTINTCTGSNAEVFAPQE
jgi:hypothetical protein